MALVVSLGSLKPGRYVLVDVRPLSAWVSFSIDKHGAVTFKDAKDGMARTWSINHSEGHLWVASMEKMIAEGTLRLEVEFG